MTVDELYDAYVPAVSEANMAISREMAHYLDRLARQENVYEILDLGSGLSSAIFRLSGKAVVTIDTSTLWLERTMAFLTSVRLSTYEMYLWPDGIVGCYDIVFHDLGDMQVRRDTLPVAIKAARNGILVLDDLHSEEYRTHALDLLAQRDEFGRFGLGFVL